MGVVQRGRSATVTLKPSRPDQGRNRAFSPTRLRTVCFAIALGLGGLLAGCGSNTAAPSAPSCDGGSLLVSPQNTELLVGVNRVSIALTRNDSGHTPVLDAQVSLEIQGGAGTFETRPLQYVGHSYANIPLYLGAARFDQSGQFRMVAHATSGGKTEDGTACVTVGTKAKALPVGFAVPTDVRQPVVGDPGVTLPMVDSGVPADDWHGTTITDGLAQHRPMVLFFAEPGRCPSQTCGPSLGVVQQLAARLGGQLLFEHIEVHYPASQESLNPAYVRFGLESDPWVYFINAQGVVADRFEGPVTLDQLLPAAQGTLAGKVPAVNVTL